MNSNDDTPQKSASVYRVLARKYRPEDFSSLIGQPALVQTLKNAFAINRIAQAYMLTGVRGVGKTTTARIIARALNYKQGDQIDTPTLDMPEYGEHCQAILESRHVDVVEMDAASHTGINDIREIIEQVRYRPISARYKVYIIDEVHMLSNQAFNGLLKTLEEPPEHVKFIFATTEIRKVPVTILSRCQRFDLKRVDMDLLISHMQKICNNENVTSEDEALGIIARASEGCVRDCLSILDQSIAHGQGHVTAELTRDMLGYADKSKIVDLFKSILKGETRKGLELMRLLYTNGADPVSVLNDLSEFLHLSTRLKYVPEAINDPALSQLEKDEAKSAAENIDSLVLSRTWQALIAGIQEVSQARKPLLSAEMVIVRLSTMADLPLPEDLIKLLGEIDEDAEDSSKKNSTITDPAENQSPAPALSANSLAGPGSEQRHPLDPEPDYGDRFSSDEQIELHSYQDVIELAKQKRDAFIRVALEKYIRPGPVENGKLMIGLTDDAPSNIVNELSRRLFEWTGKRWMVALSSDNLEKTRDEIAAEDKEKRTQEAMQDEAVQEILSTFPGAKIVEIRDLKRNS